MEAPPLERKLVAILAADVERYSRLMGIDEERTLATLSSHRAITDRLIARHSGRICGTAGDSLLAEFASVFAAVECAVEIQRELADANQALTEDRRMQFRIGINVGDVMIKDGDIFGDGVNIASRLEGLAAPGGICISRGVRDHIRRKLPYTYEDLGERSVKNIAQPIRAFRLIADKTEELMAASLQIASTGGPAPVPEPGAHAGTSADQSVEITFWESVKDSTVAADFEAYLQRYPEGGSAALARIRLERLAAGTIETRDEQDRTTELTFWETIRESGDPASLQAYLEKYPEGEFRSLAEIQLRQIVPTEER